jgi:hypothetical protein
MHSFFYLNKINIDLLSYSGNFYRVEPKHGFPTRTITVLFSVYNNDLTTLIRESG